MAKARAAFPFELVIMLGDNMYGGQKPDDFIKKFEQPYTRRCWRLASSFRPRSAITTGPRTCRTGCST